MRYLYSAKSFKGERVRDEREAESKRELAKVLRQEGFVLISAEPAEETAGKKPAFNRQISIFGRVGLKEKIVFTRNLKVMLSAGVSLPGALNTLAVQTKNPKFQKALLEIRKEVLGGNKLSDGLSRFPKIFGAFYYHLVKVGEESGTLEQSLESLNSQMEKEYELKSSVQGALAYPSIVILAMIGIAVLMLLVVIPQIAETFEGMNVELPFTTKAIMGGASFLSGNWYLLVLIIFFFLLGILWMAKNKSGRKFKDRLLLGIPVVSSLIKKSNSAYSIRSLATLVEAGVPILQALEVIKGGTGNHYFKKSLEDAIQTVERGGRISESLEPHSGLYTSMVIQMIRVGEETGQTSDILKRTADFLEEEVGKTTKNLSQTIEPILILVIGGAIGFFAISIIQPIYQMMGAL